jgi:chaperonin GroES
MEIRPLHDRIALRRDAQEEMSAGGIALVGEASEPPAKGEVIAVGNGGYTARGELIPMTIKVGDHVLFGKMSGVDMEINNETITFIHESDVVSIIK